MKLVLPWSTPDITFSNPTTTDATTSSSPSFQLLLSEMIGSRISKGVEKIFLLHKTFLSGL